MFRYGSIINTNRYKKGGPKHRKKRAYPLYAYTR